MARSAEAAVVLTAAERWKQACLVRGGSLFGDEQLWIADRFRPLRTYFVERPDEGSGSFVEKLVRQLEPAPPETRRLAAEVTWLYYLIVHSSAVSPARKLDRIRTIWGQSGVHLPDNHWALDAPLDQGVCHPGQGYLSHQWREFAFIVKIMLDWLSLSDPGRAALLDDPWRFANWLDGQADADRRQFRHALLFLLFPDAFQGSMSTEHKRRIVETFGEDDVSRDVNLIDLDRALLAISERLRKEEAVPEIDFYRAPWAERWRRGDATTGGGDDRVDEASADMWYRERFGTADTWLIAAGEGARFWGDFQESGIVAIGYGELGDLAEYRTREEVHDALVRHGRGANPTMHSLAAWQFARHINIGDILLAKEGRGRILGWGTVTGNYAHDPERSEYRNIREVEWHPCRVAIHLDKPVTVKTLTSMTRYKSWLRDVFTLIDDDAPPPPIEPWPYGMPDALSDLFLEETQFRRMLDSLALRKNLILQGAPGVGKTFVARRLAWCLIGSRDAAAIEMVQFHQSYAYEDFVQGWRPTETGGFTLRNGVFFEFCKRAEQRPDARHVFIIDEINRGNLSRIFGELLMLIEADKRGPEHAIALTYGDSGERFHVPENVHVLGMMNTADRSLAIVDYALRRRFAFETLDPAYGTRRFREYLLDADVERDLVDRIDRNLSSLNEAISEDKDLGPGFRIGHSYFVPEETADDQWYQGIIDTQIAPLLREYWFDRPEQVDSLVSDLRR